MAAPSGERAGGVGHGGADADIGAAAADVAGPSSSTLSAVGCWPGGTDLSKAIALMIWPLWQYPHCATSCLTQAACTAAPTRSVPSVAASIVVSFLPSASEMGVIQERMAWPSRCTVQAPHWAAPPPNFVPVSPIMSRSAQSRGIAGSASIVNSRLFTVSFISLLLAGCLSRGDVEPSDFLMPEMPTSGPSEGPHRPPSGPVL